jgi:hypothetical protein
LLWEMRRKRCDLIWKAAEHYMGVLLEHLEDIYESCLY